MSEKTSKVKQVLGVRETDTTNGKVWYYKLELDNGDIGDIGKKKPDFFKVGDSLTYTSEDSQYGLKFKAVQAANGFGGYAGGNGNKGASRGGNESFALSYSKDVVCAMLAAGNIPQTANSQQIADTITATADKFLNWLNANKG